MNRIKQLDIRNRPFVSALFHYEDSFIDPALRIHGDIYKALFLYLKHEGYDNIVFYSTQYGPNSFDKQMLVNFINPGDPTPAVAGTGNAVPANQSPAAGNSPFGRRARQVNNPATTTAATNTAVPVFDATIARYIRGNGGGDRNSIILHLGYALTKLKNSVLIIEANNADAECEPSASSKFLADLKSIGNGYKESPRPSEENRVIVLVQIDSPNANAITSILNSPAHSIFLTNPEFVNLWQETMPALDEVYAPKDNLGGPVKRLSARSYPLPPPQSDDLKLLIEQWHLKHPNVPVDWHYLDELSQQLFVLSTVAGDNNHTLEGYSRLLTNAPTSKPIGFDTFKQLETKKMKLTPPNDNELYELIGLRAVKETVDCIKDLVEFAKMNGEDPVGEFGNHMLFLGNPGTGKTTVARIVAKMMKNLGLVTKGQLIEVSAENLVSNHVGETAIKTSEVIDAAMDGVLFIDEAYRLAEEGSREFGAEAVNTLLARMENDRKRLIVIMAGYEENMKSLYAINPGLKSRIRHYINFEDYTADELKQIFILMAKKQNFVITDEVDRMLTDMMEYAVEVKNRRTDEVRAANARMVNNINQGNNPPKVITYNFGNGRWVRNVLAAVKANAVKRIMKEPGECEQIHGGTKYVLKISDFKPLPEIYELVSYTPGVTTARHLDERSAIDKLNDLIGMQPVKDYVKSLQEYVEYRKNNPNEQLGTQHLLLYGNPGTGKSTVARLLADIYHELGILPNRNIVEVKREHLVAGFVGHTAPNVANRVEAAKGGVLFIDEAYTLANDNSGKEAINALMTYLENDRSELVVIMAGYEERMNQLLSLNDGLESRFQKPIILPDYSPDELLQIAELMLNARRYTLSIDAKRALSNYITAPQESNARWVRNLVDKILGAHRKRCVTTASYDTEIAASDVATATI